MMKNKHQYYPPTLQTSTTRLTFGVCATKYLANQKRKSDDWTQHPYSIHSIHPVHSNTRALHVCAYKHNFDKWCKTKFPITLRLERTKWEFLHWLAIQENCNICIVYQYLSIPAVLFHFISSPNKIQIVLDYKLSFFDWASVLIKSIFVFIRHFMLLACFNC